MLNVNLGTELRSTEFDSLSHPLNRASLLKQLAVAQLTKNNNNYLQVEKSPWWYVNLLEPYMVQLVRIDFGQSCCGEKY